MYIKPKPGHVVRNPETMERIPEDGIEVKQNGYWLRRVKDGDVEVVKPEKKKKPSKKTETKKSFSEDSLAQGDK